MLKPASMEKKETAAAAAAKKDPAAGGGGDGKVRSLSIVSGECDAVCRAVKLVIRRPRRQRRRLPVCRRSSRVKATRAKVARCVGSVFLAETRSLDDTQGGEKGQQHQQADGKKKGGGQGGQGGGDKGGSVDINALQAFLSKNGGGGGGKKGKGKAKQEEADEEEVGGDDD